MDNVSIILGNKISIMLLINIKRGEYFMKKTLADMAQFLKNIIPTKIPEVYSIKPMFKNIADEESVRNGILALRDFYYSVFDKIYNNCSLYENPLKNIKDDHSHPSLPVSYPFLDNVKSVLFNIGYHGNLLENNTSILLSDFNLLTNSIGVDGGIMRSKITMPKLIQVLKFLSDCGMDYDGIELESRKPDVTNIKSLKITYPNNPYMLIGLKVMAIAQKELYSKGNHDIFLRCDYRVLKDEDTEVISILEDFISTLPLKVQEFAINLHQRYLNAGLTCKVDIFYLNIRFIYLYKNIEIWSFSASVDTGYRILIKAKHIHQYLDLIKNFSLPLQEKIAKGYGCNKKIFGEPCEKGCHGFSFPLDLAADMREEIEIWLDKEVFYSIYKK